MLIEKKIPFRHLFNKIKSDVLRVLLVLIFSGIKILSCRLSTADSDSTTFYSRHIYFSDFSF